MAYPALKNYPSWVPGIWEAALHDTYEPQAFLTRSEAKVAQFKLNGWRRRAIEVLNDPTFGGLSEEQATNYSNLAYQVADMTSHVVNTPEGWFLHIRKLKDNPLSKYRPSWEVEAEQKLFSNLTNTASES